MGGYVDLWGTLLIESCKIQQIIFDSQKANRFAVFTINF